MIKILPFFFSLLLFSSLIQAEDVIRFVYFNNYPPFSWEENGKMKGLLIDMVDEVLVKKLKQKVQHEGYPWARAQKLVELGEADGFVTLPIAERLNYAIPTKEAFIQSTYRVYTSKDHPKLNELKKVHAIQELAPYQIAFYIGSGWAKKNEANFPKKDWSPTLDICLKKVASQKVDIHVEAYPIARYTIKNLKLENKITELPKDIDPMVFHLLLGKKSSHQNLIPQIDQAVRKSKKDGSFDKILTSYGL